MADFLEIDFLDVETKKSGDAIPLRYEINGRRYVHVVDGGYQSTGEKVSSHIKTFYDNVSRIDHVVATHPDGDHLGGLQTVLEQFGVGTLWMLRPWQYAAELLSSFPTYSSVDKLRGRLRSLYPNIAALEEIAQKRKIEIREPFQGAMIGSFTVLAPSRARYLQLIIESDRTPETAADVEKSVPDTIRTILGEAYKKVVNLIKGAWGEEVFSTEETSAENEMSVVQYANLGTSVLLTADAGRSALAEAADYATNTGRQIPVDMVQIPHHGSRRNVSTELLDRWMGPRLAVKPQPGAETKQAFVSSAKEDEDHPRKVVVRAFIHRGAGVFMTEGKNIRFKRNAPRREGWGPSDPAPYPEDYES